MTKKTHRVTVGVYRVIHILILEYSLFFHYNLRLMTQQSIEQNQNLIRTHHLFELKVIEEMKMSQHDKLLSMSQEAQLILMKLGVEWQLTTGFQSWVDKYLLVAMIKIPDDTWTVNKLSKWSGYGRSGIEYSLVPFMLKVGIITRDASSRFTKYSVTVHGREALETMVYNCNECDNTRACTHCENGVGMTDRWGDPLEPCRHIMQEDCTDCERTGLVDCDYCDGTGKRGGSTDDDQRDCYRCCGRDNPKGKISCWRCTTNCTECIDDTRVLKCVRCHGNVKCDSCEDTLNHLIHHETSND